MRNEVRGIRGRSQEAIPKIQSLLTENETLRAKDLAKRCHVTITQVYRAIKLMRKDGTGVMPVRGGYVLSRLATKKQDVMFMRRMLGRRASDNLSVLAAKPDMMSRWRSADDKRAFLSIVSPMTPNPKLLESGASVLLTYVNKMGL